MDEIQPQLGDFGVDFFNCESTRRHAASQIWKVWIDEVGDVVEGLLLACGCDYKGKTYGTNVAFDSF